MALRDRFQQIYGKFLGKPDGRSSEVAAQPDSPLRIRVGKYTSIGNYRDNNEDRLFVDDAQQVYIVADGMGGQAAGEQASQLAVDLVPSKLSDIPLACHDGELIRRSVSQAVVAANEAIIAQGAADPNFQNMGTTIVMVMVRGPMAYVAHLGDSRAYLIRDHQIQAITVDHNLAQALYEAKTISKEDLKTHRFRHMLWKYLGAKEAGDGPELKEIELKPGDRLLLATDGLTGALDDDVLLEESSSRPDPQKCAEELVNLSLDRGSKDNVTCVIINVDAE